jgi:hypothetical protein
MDYDRRVSHRFLAIWACTVSVVTRVERAFRHSLEAV